MAYSDSNGQKPGSIAAAVAVTPREGAPNFRGTASTWCGNHHRRVGLWPRQASFDGKDV